MLLQSVLYISTFRKGPHLVLASEGPYSGLDNVKSNCQGNNNFEFPGYLTYLTHVLLIEENSLLRKTPRQIPCPLNPVLDIL